jgi:ABC-type multidrug transport system fused ATPase/permease subunit
VGENGAGKTTFVKLLMRLYDVTEGEILYDGVNIKDYNYDDYMDVFSTLFQDYKVFAISIYENVTFHENPQDKDKIDDIFKEYGIFDKVQSLPKKGETIMSKEFEAEGMELSGGQQQRLAICRAVYKNAPFYILDEPTANLSPVAEHDIYLQFDKMVGGKSAIYISHRLSSSKFCDKICVFDKGQIAEYGSHNELMKNDGIYAKMFRLQSQYYVEKV